jgi:hypothetical protein
MVAAKILRTLDALRWKFSSQGFMLKARIPRWLMDVLRGNMPFYA